jgi:putative polyketide hydroxylase
MANRNARHAQALVVGAGPAGLVAGITLARYGVDVLVVDKRNEIATLSRALVISTRSMEILRSWGLEDAVRAGAADVEPCGWVTHTLASDVGTQIPLGYPTAAEAARSSPTRPAWVPQDHLEPVLLAHLRRFPRAEVCFGAELMALDQREDGVRAVLRDRSCGRSWAVDALFVVGADGAHSTVREQLQIRMDGPDNLGEYHRVEFRAPLATIAGERRYGLTIITHPEASGVLAPRGPHDRWGFTREWRPGQRRLVDSSDEQLMALIATAVGVPDLRPCIERRSAFSFAAQIAERYRERRGFLVGDAAHRVTPRGGTGMNTAIQDAYDLGWKLGWVLRGWAEPALLDSYEAERRPVGLHNVARTADPDGARREAAEALPWDLNGRLAHHWIEHGGRTASTLDLLGDGWSVLAGPEEPGWTQAVATLHINAPVAVHILTAPVARSLGIAPGGALLLRPDGQPVQRWATLTRPLQVPSSG